MNRLNAFFNASWKINLWLFAFSFGIYFFYFHHLLLNINSLLSSLTSDAPKNYYTYVYHITNDQSLLHFEGMNYPFGEHVVYTDCQPLLTFILRGLPFTHNYLIGILHGLIFLSYAITPLILYRIFMHFEVAKFPAFFISLAIALLSPQFWRLDGHFALTYECVIPFAILLLITYFRSQKITTLLGILAYNSALFLLHPYLGLGSSILCFLFILDSVLIRSRPRQLAAGALRAVAGGLLPIILFKLFLLFTDQHSNRTNEPFGIDISVASIASVFVASYGPFQQLLKTCISSGPQEFEGLAYLGFFSVLLTLIFLLALVFAFRKLVVRKEITALCTAAILLLLFSFGLHNTILKAMGLHLAVFDQFRSLGRFAWFFYYAAPIALTVIFYQTIHARLQAQRVSYLSGAAALLFFCFNVIEADVMLNVYAKGAFKDRNVFRRECLTAGEKAVLASMKQEQPQAIITLPLYYIGSEVYSRIGGGNSILPSMIYSYHALTPIVGGSLSRTSITETEDAIELLNPYKRNRRALGLCNAQPFLVIKTNDALLPDEARLAKKTTMFYRNDSSEIGYVSKKHLANPQLQAPVHTLYGNSHYTDSSPVIYLHHEPRRPFLLSNVNNYENIYTLDSNVIKGGTYVVSLHYHFAKKTYKDVYNHLIVTRTNAQQGYTWEYSKAIRLFSGFYNGFAVFEYPFFFDSHSKYEFMLKGDMDNTYHVSDFMLRPDSADVRVILDGKDTLINNFRLKP